MNSFLKAATKGITASIISSFGIKVLGGYGFYGEIGLSAMIIVIYGVVYELTQ